MKKKGFYGDDFLELEDLYGKLKEEALQELILTQVHFMTARQYSFMYYNKKDIITEAVKDAMWLKMMRDPKYAEILEKQFKKKEVKEQPHSMFQ